MAVGLTVDTGSLDSWAGKLEQKAADIAAEAVKTVKRSFEVDRERYPGRHRLRKVRRLKSGAKRFIAPGPPIDKAQLIPKTFAAIFDDIFKE
jgi:hypothetical protein